MSFSSVDLTPLDPAEMTMDQWGRMIDLLRPSVEMYPDGDMSCLIEDAKNYEGTFWAVHTDKGEVYGALYTRCIEFATGYKVLMIQVAGKDPRVTYSKENLQDIATHMEGVAEGLGCDAVRICGRKGWGRVLQGYHEVERTYDKVLSGGLH